MLTLFALHVDNLRIPGGFSARIKRRSIAFLGILMALVSHQGIGLSQESSNSSTERLRVGSAGNSFTRQTQRVTADPQPPLDAQCASFLKASSDPKSPGWEALSPVDARKSFASLNPLFGIGPLDVRCEDRTMDNQIPLRFYRPSVPMNPPTARAVVMYFHGGGWVLGDIATHDALCRRLCQAAECVVVSVGYRLAPEDPYPAALEDCYAATQYVASHAKELEIDAARLVVAGDSAGGNLAAAVALRSRDAKSPKIHAQVLIYPALNPDCDSTSYREFSQGYGLTRTNMQWFWKQYVGNIDNFGYAAPSKADSLAGLPRTILVTAQYDVLRDEGEEYAAKLKAAGVIVEHRRYDGMIHGFIHFAGAFDKGLHATQDIAHQLKTLLHTTH